MQKQEKKVGMQSRAKQKRRKRQIQVGVRLIVAAVILFALAYIFTYQYVNKDKGMIHDHVFIGEVEVSGMNMQEAVTALQTKVEEYGEQAVTFKVGESFVETTLKELGFSMNDVEKLAEQAMDYGRKGSVWKRFGEVYKLKRTKKTFEAEFQVNSESMTAFVETQIQPLETRAQNATIQHTGDGFEITDEVAGNMVDAQKSVEEFNQFLNEKWQYTAIEFEVNQVVEEPKIKRTDLESIQDVLGTFHTDAGYGERKQNLKRATELINGTVLMPGEVFSVEKSTIPYTVENGYVEGTAYENGQIIKSIGGGLCQVSTTLYNAVLNAELEIVTRAAHSMMVDYVKPSHDAAIAEGVKDLQFKNSYDTPVLIEGYIDGSNQLRFYVYGKETRPENRSVEYISEVLEEKPYTKKFVASTERPLGEKSSEGAKINGAVARLWKVVYEDGVEVSRKKMNNSNYSASEVKITIGVASDNAEASELLKKAIETQDEAKINDAINQAKEIIERAKADETGESGTDGV